MVNFHVTQAELVLGCREIRSHREGFSVFGDGQLGLIEGGIRLAKAQMPQGIARSEGQGFLVEGRGLKVIPLLEMGKAHSREGYFGMGKEEIVRSLAEIADGIVPALHVQVERAQVVFDLGIVRAKLQGLLVVELSFGIGLLELVALSEGRLDIGVSGVGVGSQKELLESQGRIVLLEVGKPENVMHLALVACLLGDAAAGQGKKKKRYQGQQEKIPQHIHLPSEGRQKASDGFL
jgi:hypothetical protein